MVAGGMSTDEALDELDGRLPELADELAVIDLTDQHATVERNERAQRVAKRRSDVRTTNGLGVARELALFDELLGLCNKLIEQVIDGLRQHIGEVVTSDPSPAPSRGMPPETVYVMTVASLFASVVQLCGEIRELAISGFPEGANARMRTLYETYVKLTLITEDQSGLLAERFCDHAVCEHSCLIISLVENAAELRWDPPPQPAVERAQKERQRILDKWGQHFSQSNEWARPAVPGNPTVIGFRHLQRAVDVAHLNPVYLIGNRFVHSGPLAAINRWNFNRTQPLAVGPQDDCDVKWLLAACKWFLTDAASFVGGVLGFRVKEWDAAITGRTIAALQQTWTL